jgi:hypothetical protein
MMIMGFIGIGFMALSAEEQAAVPLRLNDQIANAETAFGRSLCLMVVQKLDRSA